jgi:hypothetical protein
MERINLKDQSPQGIFLAHLVSSHKGKITNGLYADVELKVNGVAVSFGGAIDVFAASLDGQARTKAEAMIVEAGLDGVLGALQSARMGIKRAINEAADRLQLKEVPDAEVIKP